MSVFDLAVVGADAEAQAAAAALALACGWLRPAVVVSDAAAGGGAALTLLGMPAARRIAALADADGVVTCARGRLAFVRAQRELLVGVARRVAARADAPTVVALTQPRDEIADVLLAESVRVVVLADPEGPVAPLALEQLADIGVCAVARAALAGPSVSLARLGWCAPVTALRSTEAGPREATS